LSAQTGGTDIGKYLEIMGDKAARSTLGHASVPFIVGGDGCVTTHVVLSF
jgi:hypothetical protein